MNQEQIGKYIKLKRKNKKITQEQLSEKLGVSNKAISNWENGKNMPDLSLFKPLCEILDITINELLSGEDIEEDKYINKLEENIINVIDKNNRKMIKLKRVISLTGICIFLIIILFFLLITIQINLDYEYTNITCEKTKEKIKVYSKGNSNLYMTSRKINNIYYRIYNSKISLIDIPGDYKNHINDNSIKKVDMFDNIYEEIYIYHTNKDIKQIDELNDKEFLENIKKFELICDNK